MKKNVITTAVVLALKSLLILLMRIIKQLKNKLLILKKSLKKKLNHWKQRL